MNLKKRTYWLLVITAVILMFPFVAMQFTKEVQWSVLDFVVMGTMIFVGGLMIDIAIRKIKSPKKKTLIVSTIALLFLLLWAELAVGIFNSPLSGN